jgi:hypothetical protein
MKEAKTKVIRWPDEKLPDEALLRSILADEDLHPYVWSNGPGDVYGAHRHSYHKVIYVVRGSITFGGASGGCLPRGPSIEKEFCPFSFLVHAKH